MIILAGDIGGTKTNLGLFEGEPTRPLGKRAEESVMTRDYATPEGMVSEFAQRQGAQGRLDAACFGIAGPIEDGVCRGENLPWKEVRDTSLGKALGLPRASLLNDLETTAYGVQFLQGDQIVTLNRGRKRDHGNMAVIAAGTGLGEGGLLWRNGSYEPLACEGGHTDLAVRNELEIELLQYLLALRRPVNQEAVLSGQGLVNVYNFLKASGRAKDSAKLAEDLASASDKEKAAIISKAALAGTEAGCAAALDVFASMYGARAGNLALQLIPRGGMFVGGGIAPKNLAKMMDGAFMKAFLDKGDHFRPILEEFPVHVVLEQKTGLIGAAQYAAAHAA